jgi:hypothetical protein
LYNVPRFFEYNPVYSVAYVCPNSNLSDEKWSKVGTTIDEDHLLATTPSTLQV